MRILALIAGFHFAFCGLAAQQELTRVTISSSFPGVKFVVDGIGYRGAATFFWPVNSRHILEYEADLDGYQYDAGRTTRYIFQSWDSSPEQLKLGEDARLMVYANPDVSTIRLNVTVEYQVSLVFWKGDPVPPPDQPPPACTAPGLTGPIDWRPGVVFVDGACFWSGGLLWLAPGQHQITAFAYPGFEFVGWGFDTAQPNRFIQFFNVPGPPTMVAHFRVARRIRFLTEPLGFQVLIDNAPVATASKQPCPMWQTIPLGVPPGVERLCVGEVDWAPGIKHVIGAPTPQQDSLGQDWVFQSFSNGQANNSVYEVTTVNGGTETIVAKFVRGARVSFVTAPAGLKLNVNGRDNWMAYNFVVAPGEKFTVSAPAEQTDAQGRKHVFAGWSNGGDATQEFTVPAEAVEEGFRLTARYDMLSQAVIDSDPAGVAVQVDGAACETPCRIDRAAGTDVTIAAPAQSVVNQAHRRDFHSWTDGASRVRTVKLSGAESVKLLARYTKMYLLASSSQPEGGADFTLDPPSADGFYAQNTRVTVTAAARQGYKFRRWAGDLEGTFNVGSLSMSMHRSAIALLDEVPYVQPAGVRNAAGETPENVVAPGSIISIYGAMLAPHLDVGPANPLMQTLAGVTVRAGERVLALLFVSPDQINAVLHPDIPEGQHTLTISRPGQLDVEGEFTAARNAPGLFARVFNGLLYAMASHQDGTPVTLDSPARQGELIQVYGTGFGPYDKIAPYGFSLPAAPDFPLVDPVELFAGDLAVKPEFAGGAPGFAGADVLKIRVAAPLPAKSTVELRVRIQGRESNRVLLPIE